MLAVSFWNEISYAAQVEMLMVAAIFTLAIVVTVDLFVLMSNSIVPWKKTVIFFVASELAAGVVSCWLGVSFGQIIGWCVFAVLTLVILFFAIYLSVIKWKLN